MFLEKDKPDEASMFRFPPHTPQTFKIARLKIVKSNDQARELSEPHLLQTVWFSGNNFTYDFSYSLTQKFTPRNSHTNFSQVFNHKLIYRP